MRTIYIVLLLSYICGAIAKKSLKSPICGIKASFVGKCKGFAYIPQKNRCVSVSGNCSGKGNFFKHARSCSARCVI
ncbi:uncharacterized protein LOC119547258 [Drosophila subpulchrella]|uniref:uncharacterized protein LOC119547258 n=1 Tax=Drosophila subpulchrella TaxID=1486046 RepID=UPI0018A1448C|nr:uncharacterized protein LOC119547258 [Drosophila subpulchrella]